MHLILQFAFGKKREGDGVDFGFIDRPDQEIAPLLVGESAVEIAKNVGARMQVQEARNGRS
jgi:hypothetical protein